MTRFFEIAYLASWVLESYVRLPRARRWRRTVKVDRRVSAVEIAIVAGLAVGMFLVPLASVLTPWIRFADIGWPAAIRAGMGILGLAMLAFAVWLFWRSHEDLGASWSPSLEISAGQRLVTSGVYRAVRHPMYASALAWVLAQALLVQNWIAGLAGLVVFVPFYLVRVPPEERMMLDHFGAAYQAYANRTGRLLPRLTMARRLKTRRL